MDFRFSPDDEAFRQEVRALIRDELPAWWGRRNDREDMSSEEGEIASAFSKQVAAKGWLTLARPEEYGGQGAGPLRQLVYNEEMSYGRAPGAGTMGTNLVGPTLMVHGTDDQKRRFLPPIARLEESWCQGFSEPGSGSDLASLQTSAVLDGDDFVVNGSKIWTSGAHRADWAVLLVRTDSEAPKHRGITYLLMDMKSPGISVRPLTNMLGSNAFNQIFMDSVRVPRENVVGEVNRGWYVATTTLDFERSGIQRVMYAYRTLEDVIDYARSTRHNGGRLIDRPVVSHKLAELKIEFELGRLLCYRVAWMQAAGQIPNYEASIAKLYGSELQQRLGNAAVNLPGLGGQLSRGSAWAPLEGSLERYYLAASSYTVAAGTSEVQRNIIAMRGLGLPRG
jgi:alkylation response protein AidB-like acyl-CoA dehydrogenase